MIHEATWDCIPTGSDAIFKGAANISIESNGRKKTNGMWPLAWSFLPISLFSQPLPQRNQPNPALGILPLERLRPVDAVIEQQQLIALQFLRGLDQAAYFVNASFLTEGNGCAKFASDFAVNPIPTRQAMKELSHLDEKGQARMVDVTAKAPTLRQAVARGKVRMRPETAALIQEGGSRRGMSSLRPESQGSWRRSRPAGSFPCAIRWNSRGSRSCLRAIPQRARS